MPDTTDFKALHRLIRFISDLAVGSFFHELRVIGGENVPRTGPIIVCVVSLCCSALEWALTWGCRTATHHNMMLDPVVLCAHVPFVQSECR